MSRRASIWVAALVVLLRGCEAAGQQQGDRPSDIWDTSTWGGLPALDKTVQDSSKAPFNNFVAIHPQPAAAPSRVVNPCANPDFRPPIYELSDWNVTREYKNASGEYPNTFQIRVTLRDTANNYTMKCAGEHEITRSAGFLAERYTYCAPEDGFGDDSFQPLVSVSHYEDTLTSGSGPGHRNQDSRVYLQQYWFCTPGANFTTYPRVYKAATGNSAPNSFNITCPQRTGSETNKPLACNVASVSTIDVGFTPAWSRNQTEPLVSRPSPPPPPERGLSRKPLADCTDLSFTHPDFIFESGGLYVPSPKGGDSKEGAILSLYVKSRVTGIRNYCVYPGDRPDSAAMVMDLACAPAFGTVSDPSNSVFRMQFYFGRRDMRIQHDWSCGDTAGTYSRNYTAEKVFVPPFYCPEGDGGACRTNQHTVRGVLYRPAYIVPEPVAPPPGADKTGCTALSQSSPEWILHGFKFEEKRDWWVYVDHRDGTTPPYNSGDLTPLPPVSTWGPATNTISIQLRNKANGYGISCNFTVSDADLAAKKWLRCYSDSQTWIDTHIQFDVATAQLRINQTWYCSDTDASKPILYEGAVSTRVQFCGQTQGTLIDECVNTDPRGCDYHFFTRWCSSGRRDDTVVLPADTTIAGTTTRTIRLPANALLDPDPNPNEWSCTADSLGKPVVWTLKETLPEGFFSTVWLYMSQIADPYSNLHFDLHNSALLRRPGGGVLTRVRAWSRPLTPYLPSWRPAEAYVSSTMPFENVLGWALRFDGDSGYLELNHTWYCNDKNPGMPTLFTGTWAGKVEMQCAQRNTGDPDQIQMSCYVPGGQVVVRPNVVARTFDSMRQMKERIPR